MLPRSAEKGAVAAESSARRGAGVAYRGGGSAFEYTAFEEASGERAIQTAAVAFCVFASLSGCRRLCAQAAAPGSAVAVDMRAQQLEDHATFEVVVG